MNNIVIATFVIPLIAAITSVLLRKTRFKDGVSLVGSFAYIGVVAVLAQKVLATGALTFQAGGWPPPFGISFIADELSVLMLMLTAFVSLAGNLYSVSYIGDKGKENGYYAFFHFMIAGMTGAFLTADLFNLFVMFEIVLMSSYAMVAYAGTKESLFTSLKYVVLNLIGSSLMLIAIGGLYSVTGTLNMADMAAVLASAEVNMVPVLGLSALLFCVFAIKSGVVPFQFWVPTVYSNSPPPAAAMMAGISKKVGIYAVIRLYYAVFSQAALPSSAAFFAGRSVGAVLGWMILAISLVTLLFGGLAAVNRDRLEKLLSYSSIGQVGFIYIPVALGLIYSSKLAVMAAIVYMINHALAKSSLFMTTGIIERMSGTTRLSELGGISEKSTWLAAVFFISMMSLVGVPPLLGFFSKFMVFKTVFTASTWIPLALAFTGALFTLIYASKSVLKALFGEPIDVSLNISIYEKIALTLLVAGIVLLGVGFEQLHQVTGLAAETVVEPETYIESMTGGKK